MKTKIFILILSCISYFGYSQMDVIQAPGNDGTAIMLNNTGNYDWRIWNDRNNYWGQTNTLDFVSDDGYLCLQIYPDHHVNVNSHLIVDYHIYIYNDQTARHHQANGFDFNPNTTSPGLTLEHHGAESSGFYSDNDYAVIWSPGDYGRLLRVYDEDRMVEKWYLDASGYAHTISDKNKKENISKIDDSLIKLKSIEGVKFNYKKEDTTTVSTHIAEENPQISKTDSIWPGDIEHKDNNKYDPSKKQYYGFIAQDVEKVYPDLVSTNENGEKYISYTEFIPLLLEGYKEQQSIIEKQETEITDLTKRVELLELEIQKIYKLLKNTK